MIGPQSYARQQASAHSIKDRGLELYETPVEAVLALLRVHPFFRWSRVCWEPASGPGAIVASLQACGHSVCASDLGVYEDRWRGDPDTRRRWGVSFFDANLPSNDLECIITNPPYSMFAEFTARALTLVPDVFVLLRLAALEGGRGCAYRDDLMDRGQLVEVMPFRERLTMHRDGWGGRKQSGSMAFAWFHFQAGARAPYARLRRLSVNAAAKDKAL